MIKEKCSRKRGRYRGINVEELVLDSSKRRRVLDLDRFMEINSVMNGFKL